MRMNIRVVLSGACLCALVCVGLCALLWGCGDGASIAEESFMSSCQTTFDLSCEKGFECDSFFVKAQWNSVEHCKSDQGQQINATAVKLSESQLASCAQMCDLMRRDVVAVSCEDFDHATFKRYECGK